MESLHTVRMWVSYDGSGFFGWQFQPRARTVQGTLQDALSKILKTPIKVAAAGRTDTGVHALGQVVSFQTPVLLPEEAWVPALNAVLPRDVAVWHAEPSAPEFHARHSARRRTYRYAMVHEGPRDPLLAPLASWIRGPLDVEAMRECLPPLLGRHDFTHFGSTGSDPVSPICTLEEARLTDLGGILYLHLTADHFLYHMVRRLAGTLVRVGKGSLTVEGFLDTWHGHGPRPSGPTAPPNGLTFVEVGYPETFAWRNLPATLGDKIRHYRQLDLLSI